MTHANGGRRDRRPPGFRREPAQAAPETSGSAQAAAEESLRRIEALASEPIPDFPQTDPQGTQLHQTPQPSTATSMPDQNPAPTNPSAPQPSNQPTGGGQPQPASGAPAAPPPNQPNGPQSGTPRPSDPGSAEVSIEKAIRWKVEDPYLFLQMGGLEQVTKTILAYDEAITRAYATKIEMKPLIGLKLEVGRCIQKCFHKDASSEPEGVVKAIVKPWWSITACFAFVLLGLLWTFDSLPLLPKPNFEIFSTICVALLFIGFGLAGWKDIEEAHLGVVTVLGKRFRIFASEGSQWGLWPFISYDSVGIYERLTERKADNGIKVVAGSAEDAGDQMPSISEHIDRSFRKESGVNVIEVLNTKILPTNQDLLRAWEELEQERAKSDAEDMDMRRQGLRAAELVRNLPNLDPQEALRAVQAQEDHMTREEKIITVSGVGEGDRIIGLAAAIADQFASKGGGGKQGGKGNRGGKRRDRRGGNNRQGGRQ